MEREAAADLRMMHSSLHFIYKLWLGYFTHPDCSPDASAPSKVDSSTSATGPSRHIACRTKSVAVGAKQTLL